MARSDWPIKTLKIASLHPDDKNPRLGAGDVQLSPREIINLLFAYDNAMEVAESIARCGFFPNEPLLAIKEDGRYKVVEGNRRLAALKALRNPAIVDKPHAARVKRLSQKITDPTDLDHVSVTIAPDRRATDKQLAVRHIASPVQAWQAENRANFILKKLQEGYSAQELQSDLGFTPSDIRRARQTRAVAEIARSLDLPEKAKKAVDNPRAKLFSTIERIIDSPVGRKFLRIQPDPECGFRGVTSKEEFLRGFTRLVTDIATGKESSRSLNTEGEIEDYFTKRFPSDDLPAAKKSSFTPSDINAPNSSSHSTEHRPAKIRAERTAQTCKYALPKSLKVKFGKQRLVDIREEMTQLDRTKFRNASAVLMRVFFELTVVDYFTRTGELEEITKRLKDHGALRSDRDVPTMRHLAPEVVRVAKERLARPEALKIEKALNYDKAAPFSLSELHAFVHSDDIPSERDVLQFWLRMEPMFRLMLEEEPESK